jgi:cyanophycinase
MGGGRDVADAFAWMGQRSGCGGLLVLRTGPAGDDAYDPFILRLGTVTSAATLILLDATASTEPFVLRKIRESAAIFFAGGDQSKYWRQWQGTPVQAAVQQRVDAGCPVGGTSAGEALLSSFVDSALTGSITSVEALADPYDRRITISDSFLSLPYMTPLVADMHFVSRDRLGRLLVFLARLHEDGRAPQRGGSSPLASMGAVGGIGVDEHTALLIDRSGVASIVGVGTAYFILLQPDTSRTCQRNVPVSLGAMPTYRLSADSGGRFDLSLWRGNGGFHYNLSVVAGRIIGGQQDGGY